MKSSLFFALFIFTVIGSVLCDSSEEIVDKIKSKKLKKLLASKKDEVHDHLEELEKKCPGVNEKLKSALNEFAECDDGIDETTLTICETLESTALNCTKPLLKVIADCLPEASRGLPDLGLKSLVSVGSYLCKQTGESILELANPCLWDDDDESNAELEKCETNIRANLKNFKKDLPSSSEFCTVVTGYRSCVQTNANLKCKNQKTKDSILGLFDAIIAPCSHINNV